MYRCRNFLMGCALLLSFAAFVSPISIVAAEPQGNSDSQLVADRGHRGYRGGYGGMNRWDGGRRGYHNYYRNSYYATPYYYYNYPYSGYYNGSGYYNSYYTNPYYYYYYPQSGLQFQIGL